MSESKRTSKTRQTFNVVIGWLGVVIGGLLAAGNGTALDSAVPWAGIAFACLSFCVMVRPFIAFDAERVVISNVLREVRLPWDGISHSTSRGSLIVHDTEGGRTTVWAIGSQKARSRGALDTEADARIGLLRPVPGTLTAPPKSAGALREALDAETLDNPDGPSGRSVRWLPLPCALLVLALVCAVVAVTR